MHFTEYHVRLAAYAVITDDDAILLTWYNGEQGKADPGWSLPGGGIEFDESLSDGLVREVREETGYDVELGALLREDHIALPATPDRPAIRAQRFYFAARVTGGTLGTLEEGGTTDFARWVPMDALAGEPVKDVVELAIELLSAAEVLDDPRRGTS